MGDPFQRAPALSEERRQELLSFLERNSLKMVDLTLLNTALTHSSFANETAEKGEDNERLEFLGDSVLGAAAANIIYHRFPTRREGFMTKVISMAVSENSLYEVAIKLGIPGLLLMGYGERKDGGQMKRAVLADALEAVIASIYLDQGFEEAKRFVESFIPEQVERIAEGEEEWTDWKSTLQIYTQKKNKKTPLYRLVEERGPDHDKKFLVTVEVNGKTYGPVEGGSKKHAEQNAARVAVTALGLLKVK